MPEDMPPKEDHDTRLSALESQVAEERGTNAANWRTQFSTNKELKAAAKENAGLTGQCVTGIAVIKGRLAIYAGIIVLVIGFIAPMLRAWFMSPPT